MSPTIFLLSFIVFAPCAGALLLAFVPGKQHDLLRYITLVTTLLVAAASVIGFSFYPETSFQVSSDRMQDSFNVGWIPSFNIYYFLGVDGISFPLVLLTAFVSVLAMGASWS